MPTCLGPSANWPQDWRAAVDGAVEKPLRHWRAGDAPCRAKSRFLQPAANPLHGATRRVSRAPAAQRLFHNRVCGATSDNFTR